MQLVCFIPCPVSIFYPALRSKPSSRIALSALTNILIFWFDVYFTHDVDICLMRAVPTTQSQKKMLHHNWDSPRNSHFDVPTLVLAREKSMYLELVPSEGQSQCPATISAFA